MAGFFVTGKKDTVVCLLGARFWRLRPEKQKIQSSVCWVHSSGNYDREKKDTVVCLAGCAVVLFFEVAGNFDYDRKKKIQSSVGGKSAVFLLWREIFITTGEKKDALQPEKKDTVVCLMGAWFWRLRPEKKDTVVCLAGCAVVSVFSSGGKLAFFL